MSASLKVAAIQFQAGIDKKNNLETAHYWIDKAVQEGAQMIALQEMFAFHGALIHDLQAAESIPGPTTNYLSALAAQYQIYLIGGSIPETIPDSSKILRPRPDSNPRITVLSPDSAGDPLAILA